MTILSFQIIIFASNLTVWFFKKDWLIYISIFWTIWTLLFVWNGSSLMFIQLIVVWGSFWILSQKDTEIENVYEKPRRRSELPPSDDKEKTQSQEFLSGSEHYDFLIGSIKSAQFRIIILSGWINDYVVDQKFIRLLETKIRGNVKIYIGYGWENSKGEHASSKSYEAAITALNKLVEKYPAQLIVSKFANHEKTLIIDDKYLVIGSANWLSNGRYKNSEKSVVIRDRLVVKNEADKTATMLELQQLT